MSCMRGSHVLPSALAGLPALPGLIRVSALRPSGRGTTILPQGGSTLGRCAPGSKTLAMSMTMAPCGSVPSSSLWLPRAPPATVRVQILHAGLGTRGCELAPRLCWRRLPPSGLLNTSQASAADMHIWLLPPDSSIVVEDVTPSTATGRGWGTAPCCPTQQAVRIRGQAHL